MLQYHLRCRRCGATCWCRAEEDDATNSFELLGEPEWDADECEHDDYDVIDSEYDDDSRD
jgi:hypothetical protein